MFSDILSFKLVVMKDRKFYPVCEDQCVEIGPRMLASVLNGGGNPGGGGCIPVTWFTSYTGRRHS